LIAFDSNVLVYAQQETDKQDRHIRAMELIAAADDVIIPMQVLGEFLNVCRTKLGKTPNDAVDPPNKHPGPHRRRLPG
jgi:predicted nucleic acid-binding protein